MEVTRDLCSLNLLAKLMVLHHYILFNLVTAAITEAILIWISAEHVSALSRVAPRNLKLVISSNFCPFLVISALKLFLLLALILLFSVLICNTYALAQSTSLLVRSYSSPLMPHTCLKGRDSAQSPCLSKTLSLTRLYLCRYKVFHRHG